MAPKIPDEDLVKSAMRPPRHMLSTVELPDGHGYELVSSVRALVPQKFSVEEELLHVKHVEVKSPHVGVMWKFGREVISSVGDVVKKNPYTTKTMKGFRLSNKNLEKREIGQRVERNKETVMLTCQCRMKEETMVRARRHPPHSTTERDNRWIGQMDVMDHSTTSRPIAQQIQSHHLVSTLTIRRRLRQSGMSTRRPMVHLSLTGNYMPLRR
ncbi:transposable element Tc1 transposase [Trichonephila clavipes]|nr:transposable element Tc1 transposase [Trichonephila clavipes]